MDLLDARLLGLLTGKHSDLAKKGLGVYNRLTTTPKLLFDLLTARTDSDKAIERGKYDMIPSARPKPGYDDSYDEIAEAAEARQKYLAEMAQFVRSQGGGARDVRSAWNAYRGKMPVNPADLLRGAGRDIPRQGGIVFSDRQYRVRPIPLTTRK